jgi:hypothetical protein
VAVSLHLNWCSHEAAKYAVEHWHYSRAMPAGKTVKIGVWENERFIGCVIFSLGANRYIGSPYGLTQWEACELTRVALDEHEVHVTRILSIAIKMLKWQSPGLRLIVSYADENQDHLGIIYQAGNWLYEGEFANEQGIMIKGELIHRRTVNSKYGTSSLSWLRKHVDPRAKVIDGKSKHKYLYPLDKKMRKRIQKLSKSYPK